MENAWDLEKVKDNTDLASIWILEGHCPKKTIKLWKDVEFLNKIETLNIIVLWGLFPIEIFLIYLRNKG